MNLKVVPVTDPVSWNFYLDQVEHYDMYHTWLYHSLSTEGEARLLVFEQGESLMLLPLLFRDIPGTEWKDVSSVYGYAGWVCRQADFSPALFEVLEEYMVQEKVVSVFSRLHPLIEGSDCFLKGIVQPMNITTGIDMCLSSEEQFHAYSESVRRSIRKNQRLGLKIRQAESREDLHQFIEIYYQAMRSMGAAPHYFFSEEYFEQLWGVNHFKAVVLLAEVGNIVVGGAMFTICKGIMQYHLGGVVPAYLHYSPLKGLIDAARALARTNNCTYFHLGGGYGGDNDTLFTFKSRMTTLRYRFKTLRWIIDPEAYNYLSAGKKKAGFFPLYRSIE